MAKNLETLFKERIQTKLSTLKNIWFYKSQEVAVRGIPDIIMCLNGFFIALELKRDAKATIDALQIYNIHRINKKGKGTAFVVHPENWPRIFEKLKILDSWEYEEEMDNEKKF